MTMMEFALQEELRPWVLATIGGVTIKKVMAVTGHWIDHENNAQSCFSMFFNQYKLYSQILKKCNFDIRVLLLHNHKTLVNLLEKVDWFLGFIVISRAAMHAKFLIYCTELVIEIVKVNCSSWSRKRTHQCSVHVHISMWWWQMHHLNPEWCEFLQRCRASSAFQLKWDFPIFSYPILAPCSSLTEPMTDHQFSWKKEPPSNEQEHENFIVPWWSWAYLIFELKNDRKKKDE